MDVGTPEADRLVDRLFRSRASQMVALLTRALGLHQADLAEDAVQEAMLRALQHWPKSGVPVNPEGWLFRVARNSLLDGLRRRRVSAAKGLRQPALPVAGVASLNDWLDRRLQDDELRMVLLSCHPSIPHDSRVALSLRAVSEFGTREIARAFLVDEATIAQRIVRAKRLIRRAPALFHLPANAELPGRRESVLEVLYLMFNEGYAAGGGSLIRPELCAEALRLGRLVAASPMASPMVDALVALMAFQASRLTARQNGQGDLMTLEAQDRGLWDRELIGLGFKHLAACATGGATSTYHLQAAIAAQHARTVDGTPTDWKLILMLYDQLLEIHPSPVISLNRAVAVAKFRGPAAGLTALRPLKSVRSLNRYYLLPAVEALLLIDLGDRKSAACCLERAVRLPCSEPERRLLEDRLALCRDEPDHRGSVPGFMRVAGLGGVRVTQSPFAGRPHGTVDCDLDRTDAARVRGHLHDLQ